jgi:hypothetical protein
MQGTTPPTNSGEKSRSPLWVRLAITIAVSAVAGVVIVLFAAHFASSSGPSTIAVGGASTPTSGEPVGGGYIATGDGFVEFIQWTDNDGNLTGAIQAVTTTNQPPREQTSSNTVSVTGTLQGSTLSITFDGQPAEFGTMSGNGFTLNVPQSDGSLASVSFRAANATDFNSAVAAFDQNVHAANQTEINQEYQAWLAEPVCVSDPNNAGNFTCTWPDGHSTKCFFWGTGDCPEPRRSPGDAFTSK